MNLENRLVSFRSCPNKTANNGCVLLLRLFFRISDSKFLSVIESLFE